MLLNLKEGKTELIVCRAKLVVLFGKVTGGVSQIEFNKELY